MQGCFNEKLLQTNAVEIEWCAFMGEKKKKKKKNQGSRYVVKFTFYWTDLIYFRWTGQEFLQSETTPIPPLKQEMTVLWDSWLIIQH